MGSCLSNNNVSNTTKKDSPEQVFRKIQCAVCYNQMDHYRHTPMCLPCFHTICLRCIKHLNKKQCPFDHKPFKRFGKNFQLLNLIAPGTHKKQDNSQISISQEQQSSVNQQTYQQIQQQQGPQLNLYSAQGLIFILGLLSSVEQDNAPPPVSIPVPIQINMQTQNQNNQLSITINNSVNVVNNQEQIISQQISFVLNSNQQIIEPQNPQQQHIDNKQQQRQEYCNQRLCNSMTQLRSVVLQQSQQRSEGHIQFTQIKPITNCQDL